MKSVVFTFLIYIKKADAIYKQYNFIMAIIEYSKAN